MVWCGRESWIAFVKVIRNLVMVYRANAIVRIRGLRFSAFFEEFVLSERSEEFMEVE
jgi:hypothetical protein